MVPFLMERADDLVKLRPPWVTEIYHEALQHARDRSEAWLPSEIEAENYARCAPRGPKPAA